MDIRGRKLEYLNSILSGTIVFKIGKDYVYVSPFSAQDKTFADFFSQEAYDDAIIDGIWTQEEAEQYLIEKGYWSEESAQEFNSIGEKIDQMKVDYFNHFYNSQTKKYIKKNIEKQMQRQQEFHAKRYVFYDKTCDYLKQYSFTSYLLQKNSFLIDGGLAHEKLSNQLIYSRYITTSNEIASKIREISKSDKWKSKWYAIKDKSFTNDDLTEHQLSIVSWSNYYDNVYQSIDRPLEEVIKDDIALDGWSILENRKRKEEDKKRNAEKILPKNLSNANEIFIPARNQREAEDIFNLNDGQGKARINSIKNDLQIHGSLTENQLSDTQRELYMTSMQMAKENKRSR
jgi:hypothetical protein